MALSKAQSDDDRTRFFRLSSVIIEELTSILQDLLHREIRPCQILNKVKQNIFQILRPEQIVLISHAKVNGYKEFDISLLYTLLRNLCPNIQHPTQNWGTSNMPAQSETTEGDDIERIRLIRNKLFGHISSPTISETDFEETWCLISEICKRMDNKIPNTLFMYAQRLEEAKERTIDSDMENKYIEKMKELVGDEYTVKKLLLKLIEDKELTSDENISIEAKTERKRKFAETLCDISIRILNEMVDTIQKHTTESEIEQLYEAVDNFIQNNKEEIENCHLQIMLEGLGEKITKYANLKDNDKMQILARFLRFSAGIKKIYEASVESSKGSLILSVTFSSQKGYDLYKQDLEKGIIKEQIRQLFLYSPYLASFGLRPVDLIVCMNGQELTQENGDEFENKTSSYLEKCAYHENHYYTRACQQCQLPVCVQCIGNSKHKDHSFTSLRVLIKEQQVQLQEKLEQGLEIENKLRMNLNKILLDVNEIQSRISEKYRALQCLLDEILQKNLDDINGMMESRTEYIRGKLNFIDHYIADILKYLNVISEHSPAKALIQLQDCFENLNYLNPNDILYPQFEENETSYMDVSNLFENLYEILSRTSVSNFRCTEFYFNQASSDLLRDINICK